MISIRRNLLLSLLASVLFVAAIMVGFSYINTTSELHELFADNLRRMALVIKGQAFVGSSQNPTDMDTEELEESYIIQVWAADRTIKRSSRPDLNLPLQSEEGLHLVSFNERIWEIYTLKADNAGYVQIAQPQEIVRTMIGETAIWAVLPFILCFIILIIGGWIVVGRSLSPLNKLSKAIHDWDADSMQPLPLADAPVEIKPIIGALNALLVKLDIAMEMQRQFTADSAHELRTPLTAIKLQLDNLVRSNNEAERSEAVSRLSDGIDRCIHLATQLLTASRSMAVKAAPKFQVVHLNELIRNLMASFAVVASSKQVEIAFEEDVDWRIRGDEEGLRALVSNLLDNAIRYTPKSGKVVVRLKKEKSQLVLEVSDSGTGIPKDEYERIFQRFYRMPGTTSTGSGLGLSIVKTVADTHKADISVSNGPFQKGTTVRVVFPPTA